MNANSTGWDISYMRIDVCDIYGRCNPSDETVKNYIYRCNGPLRATPTKPCGGCKGPTAHCPFLQESIDTEKIDPALPEVAEVSTS